MKVKALRFGKCCRCCLDFVTGGDGWRTVKAFQKRLSFETIQKRLYFETTGIQKKKGRQKIALRSPFITYDMHYYMCTVV